MTQVYDHDVVVIGSGFGGSVAALRLAEKGYRVQVYEAGRRFAEWLYSLVEILADGGPSALARLTTPSPRRSS